jgi:uncharacterized protein YhfF
MKQRPILFSTPMIQAILDGRKTVTRRVVKGDGLEWLKDFTPEFVADPANRLCPYGQPLDQLWVKETFTVLDYEESTKMVHMVFEDVKTQVCQLTDEEWAKYEKWQERTGKKPSLFMFKSMSRIHLEITDVKVERLQDITEEEARAEGVTNPPWESFVNCFQSLWQSINGPESWDANPWVWAVSFKPNKKQ